MSGGRENDYSPRDLYLVSMAKTELVGNLTGLSVGWSGHGQNIFLQYLQQSETRVPNPPFSVEKVIGAAWYGSFLEGMVMPIVSYHKQGTSRLDAYDKAMSAGLRLSAMKFTIEVDYLSLEQEKLFADDDAKLISIVTHIQYVHENFRSFAKFISETGEKAYQGIVMGATDSKRTSWELGLEYSPDKDEDMRYHLVYNNSESKNDDANRIAVAGDKVAEQKIFLGVTFSYNILK